MVFYLMRKAGTTGENLEKTIQEILKSKAQSKIYLYLLKKSEARTEDIIKGTKLHPSTVRETLVKMHTQRIIIRKKHKNESIGKNPFLYSPLPPFQLIKRYAGELEQRLNKLASITLKNAKNTSMKTISIHVIDQEQYT